MAIERIGQGRENAKQLPQGAMDATSPRSDRAGAFVENAGPIGAPVADKAEADRSLTDGAGFEASGRGSASADDAPRCIAGSEFSHQAYRRRGGGRIQALDAPMRTAASGRLSDPMERFTVAVRRLRAAPAIQARRAHSRCELRCPRLSVATGHAREAVRTTTSTGRAGALADADQPFFGARPYTTRVRSRQARGLGIEAGGFKSL